MTEEKIGLAEARRAHEPGLNVDAATDQQDLARQTTEATTIRVVPLLAGGALIGYGLYRRDLGGLVLGVAGTGIASYAISGRLGVFPGKRAAPDGEVSVRVKKSVTINRSISEVYDAWRNIEDFPHYMSHLESVRRIDETRSHWVAKAPLGQTVEWNAEVVHDDTNRVVAWRSLDGADVENVGAVHFDEVPGGRGTEVTVTIEYMPPAGRLGAGLAKLFGEEPGQQVTDDLRRFKQYMETGEHPTTEGQPRGKRDRSLMDATLDKARQVVEAGHAVTDGVDTAPRS